MGSAWHVYMVRCKDGNLYTGITTDIVARIAAHDAGKGAKYTRGRGPVVLVWEETAESESAARKREAQIKKLSKAEKERTVLKT